MTLLRGTVVLLQLEPTLATCVVVSDRCIHATVDWANPPPLW